MTIRTNVLYTMLGASLIGLPLCAFGFPGTGISEKPAPTSQEREESNIRCLDFVITLAEITSQSCERAFSGQCLADLNECRHELRYEESNNRSIEEDCRQADWKAIEYLCEPWVWECPCRYVDEEFVPAGEKPFEETCP